MAAMQIAAFGPRLRFVHRLNGQWDASRPWYLAWAALVYPLLTVVTLAWAAGFRIQFQSRQTTLVESVSAA